MAAEYRVATATGVAWGDMTTTTLLNDGSPGDTSTGESATATDTSVTVCRYLQAAPVVVAQVRVGTINSVTAVRCNFSLLAALGTP